LRSHGIDLGIAFEDTPRSYNRVEQQSSDKKPAHPEPVTPQAVAVDQTLRRFFLLLASSSNGFVLIADSSKISVGKEHYLLDRGAPFPCSQDVQLFQIGWVRAAPGPLHGAGGEVVPRVCMLGPIVQVELSERHASNMPMPEPDLARKRL
jgi:hypothetical protein